MAILIQAIRNVHGIKSFQEHEQRIVIGLLVVALHDAHSAKLSGSPSRTQDETLGPAFTSSVLRDHYAQSEELIGVARERCCVMTSIGARGFQLRLLFSITPVVESKKASHAFARLSGAKENSASSTNSRVQQSDTTHRSPKPSIARLYRT